METEGASISRARTWTRVLHVAFERPDFTTISTLQVPAFF
jgi:hypothetical protein